MKNNKNNKFVAFTKRQMVNLLDICVMLISTFAISAIAHLILNVKFPLYYDLAIAAIYTALFYAVEMIFKIDKTMWEHASGKVMLILSADVLATGWLTYGIYVGIFGYTYWSLITAICVIFGSYFCILMSKLIIVFFYKYLHRRANLKNNTETAENNTLIVGAGWTGTVLLQEFTNSASLFNPVCFVDDSEEKNGKTVLDVPVVGTTDEIAEVVKKYNIKKIVFAIPSCDKEARKRIIAKCVDTKCIVRVVPPLQELVDKEGTSMSPQIRNVKIDDLLGRDPMVFDTEQVNAFITGKRVMVTGGGGSIGSELCRQIASFNPQLLVIVDIYENNAYDIQQELKISYPSLNLETEICSTADYEKCKILFDRYKPQLVYHAAAHKHVPLMEHVPEQAIKNNVVSTRNLCRLAIEFNVDRFLLISTDKAVNPTNVMGASKRCCEMIVKYHAQISKHTIFCAVRFGNVLGSNGSVVPLFKRQIANGGPVTLTHKDIIRYFMTTPEAVSLVLQTSVFSQNGEIFVLDMGEPVKILDLAENLIRFSGFTPYKDIDIVFTGLRPGEKLFEELLISGEGMRKTDNNKIFICKQIPVDEENFKKELDTLITLAKENKPEEVLVQLHKMIPTYHNEPDAHVQ